MFELTEESTGSNSALNNSRNHLIEINSSIIDKKLQMQWIYASSIYKPSTITDLANNFIIVLKEIILDIKTNAEKYIDSDFSLSDGGDT